MKIYPLVFILASLLSFFTRAHAQAFSLRSFTIDGGGGISTGGVYSVSGTIGQPDAGTMSGGNFTVAGGFWRGVHLLQSPETPRLFAELAGANVRIYWPLPAVDFVLDQSLSITGAWSQAAFPYATNATHISVTVPPAGGQFYRLRKP